MKNKKEEIIINNVDVSECEFLRKCVIPDNEGCKIDDSLCCDTGNCYYKQLQKAKEELAILKDLYSGATPQRYVKYKQALAEIRELNLFSLNNSREKIAKINAIISEVLDEN